MLSSVISFAFNTSKLFCNLLISFVSGLVFEEPHAYKSAPQPWIRSLTLLKTGLSYPPFVHASSTASSQSSHNNQLSSNLKPLAPLPLSRLSFIVLNRIGIWSEAWLNKWDTELAGNFSIQSLLATALSNRWFVWAKTKVHFILLGAACYIL